MQKKSTSGRILTYVALGFAALWTILFFSGLFVGTGLQDAPDRFYFGFTFGLILFAFAGGFLYFAAQQGGLFKLGKEWLNGAIPALLIVISGLLTIAPVMDNHLNGTWYTPFWANGSLRDPEGFIKRHNDQYHFEQDTALKNYILKYRELPGINLRDGAIISGQQPKSTAPRANEHDFPYPGRTD